MMRAMASIFAMRFKRQLQYRTAAFAGLFTQVGFGFIMVMVIEAFARQGADMPMTLVQAISYTWVGQAMFRLLPLNLDAEIRSMVRTGDVVFELLRPMDLYSHWYVRGLASKAAALVMNTAPLLIVASILPGGLRIHWPDPAQLLAFVVSVCLGLFLCVSITNFLSTTLFWTISGDGVVNLVSMAVNLFTGNIIPLPFFPEWMQGFLECFPAAGIMDWPLRFFTGMWDISRLPQVMAMQLGWTLFFVLLGKCTMRRGLGKLHIQGG